MGYRSDVVMTIRGPKEVVLDAWAQFRFQYERGHASKDPTIEFMSITEENDEGPPYIVIHFAADQWKWYEGYEDIERIESVWEFFKERNADNTDEVTNGIFIRIGENDDDIETRSFGSMSHDLARVVSRIESDYSLDLENDIRSKF